MPRSSGPSHTVFLAITGLAGWAALIGLTVWPLPFIRPVELTWSLGVVLALAGMARLLAVRVFQRALIALDSAFYISAAIVFGIVPAAWVVALVLTADALVRFWRGTGAVVRGEGPWPHVAAHFVNYGGLPVLALLSLGVVFGLDVGYPLSDAELFWTAPAFTVSFLVSHYLFAGGGHWLLGTPTKTLWRDYFLKVLLAELALVPLALAMVLGYMHQGLALYLLLAATCLFFNGVYRRSVVAGHKLRLRVEELSTLDKVGRLISASLERRTLLGNIATETLRLVGHGSRLMIGVLETHSDTVRYELFDVSGKSYRTLTAPRDEGLSGWVMAHREPLLLGDVQRQYRFYSKTSTYNDPSFHSWMGVPLIIYDEVMGVMSVQSEKKGAYTADHWRVLSTIAEQAAVAIENSRLYELATVDGLTGLLVRRHFEQRLDEEWHRATRYESEFTLGLFDLDDFKALNDTYGHQAGDQALRAAAAVVRRNMRGADLAGRYGGEEFAFILPRTKLAEGFTVAERIRADVEKMPLSFDGQHLRLTTSIGVAGYPESRVTRVSDLLALADEAMYEAKRLGKNRVCVSTGGTRPPAPAEATGERGVV